MGDALFFVIYVLQQLGVMLGVGSMTLLLCAHLVALHRHEDDPQGSFGTIVHVLLGVGVALIVLSGLGAVALHASADEVGILLQPAFLFKWVLVLLVICFYFAQLRSTAGSSRAEWVWGAAGGTWYALFLVHSLAPVTTWLTLVLAYIVWVVFFGVVWSGFVLVMRGTKKALVVTPVAPPVQKSSVIVQPPPPPQPTVAPKPLPPPPIPKPVPPLPPVIVPPPPVPPPPPPAPVPPPIPKPIITPPPRVPPPVPKPTLVPQAVVAPTAPAEASNLPALRVMPQKAEDIGTYERAAVVKSS